MPTLKLGKPPQRFCATDKGGRQYVVYQFNVFIPGTDRIAPSFELADGKPLSQIDGKPDMFAINGTRTILHRT